MPTSHMQNRRSISLEDALSVAIDQISPGEAVCITARDAHSAIVDALLVHAEHLVRNGSVIKLLVAEQRAPRADAQIGLLDMRILPAEVRTLMSEQILLGAFAWHGSSLRGAESNGKAFLGVPAKELQASKLIFEGLWRSARGVAGEDVRRRDGRALVRGNA